MLEKLLKKSSGSEEEPKERGKREKAAPDPVNRNWQLGLLISLAAMALFAAYILLVRDPGLQQKHLAQTVESTARQQANNISAFLGDLKIRLEYARNDDEVNRALMSSEVLDPKALETRLQIAFPDSANLRLIPLGGRGAAVLKDAAGLDTFIEADLLSRVAAEEQPLPESFQHEDGWRTSVAVLVAPEGGAKRAALMVTVSNALLAERIAGGIGNNGKIAIAQPYVRGMAVGEQEILAVGSGQADAMHETTVPGTTWKLRFSPSRDLVQSYAPDPMLAGGIAGFAAIIIIAGLWFTQRATRKKLEFDIDLLATGNYVKHPRWKPVPMLEPVARRVRKQRSDGDAEIQDNIDQARGGSSEEDAPPPTLDQNEFFADPLFQDTNLIVEEEEDDDDFPRTIFRAYDIRGEADTDLSNDTVYRISRAIGTLCQKAGEPKVIIGADARKSSPRIKTAVVNGILDSGCDVLDLGTVTTPMLSFATHTLGPRSGVMITGSHNAPSINGLKITIAGEVLCGEQITALRARTLAEDFTHGEGSLTTVNLLPSYRDRIVKTIDVGVPLTIVVDGSNAVGGTVAPAVLEALGCVVIPLHCRVDPEFPNHDPDPSVDSNLQQLHDAIIANGADLGVCLDGDADRMICITGKGNLVRPDQLLMLFAKDVLSRNEGATVVYDVKSSSHLASVISAAGGTPLMSRTGHAFMRQKVAETNAPVGAEFSGHIYFNERWFGFDDGIYATARLIELVSNASDDLDDMLAALPSGLSTPEILVSVRDADKDRVIQQLQARAEFPGGTIDTTDGIRVEFEDGWGLVRASNTTGALTMRFESDSEAGLIKLRKTFKDQITSIVPSLAGEL